MSVVFIFCMCDFCWVRYLSEIPGPDSVVQAACPELGAVRGDVYTASTVSVALELSVYTTHTGSVTTTYTHTGAHIQLFQCNLLTL